jgi:outer membrane protein OmpA-like peptidoglycan-associated protein
MRHATFALVSALTLIGVKGASLPVAQAAEVQPDLPTLAHGTIPLRLQAEASAQVRDECAVRLIDGAPAGFAFTPEVPASTNGAPFDWHTGTAGGRAPACGQPAAPTLDCGAVVHGVRFEFDPAVLRPASAPLLDALHAGLQAASGRRAAVQGRSSSEGEAGCNLRLSQQRAQAVVDARVRRGIGADRLRATGVGEARPLARNDDETGRSLNRRVEIHCNA